MTQRQDSASSGKDALKRSIERSQNRRAPAEQGVREVETAAPARTAAVVALTPRAADVTVDESHDPLRQVHHLTGADAGPEAKRVNVGGLVAASLHKDLRRAAVLRQMLLGDLMRSILDRFVADWEAGRGMQWVTQEFADWLAVHEKEESPAVKKVQVFVTVEVRQTLKLAAVDLNLRLGVLLMAVFKEGLARLARES